MANNQIHETHKIGIIGAGASGITAAKQLSRYNPVIFEATDSIGGVWKNCSFRTTKLQTRACEYEFSDFPWPNSNDHAYFPSAAEVLNYLHNYAVKFDVLKFVKFNSKVIEVRYVGEPDRQCLKAGEYGPILTGNPSWEVAVQSTNQSGHIQWYSFELLIFCTGNYGEIPRLPNFAPGKGPEVFSGKVMHSMDYAQLDKQEVRELVHGKKLVIIGFKKSAIDLAKECANINQGMEPIMMVIRGIHWVCPSYKIWGVPFDILYKSRFAQFMWKRPNQGLLKAIVSSLLTPMRKGISKFVESYLLWKLPLEKYGLKPKHSFEEDYASGQMTMLPENFFEEAEKGHIVFKKPSKWWFYEDGVEFEDGTKVKADVVVFATGYEGRQKLLRLLPEPYRSLMVNPSGYLPLYRGTIHPMIPNMAFVGYLESLSNLNVGELRCRWLASLADKKFKVPSIEAMLEQHNKEVQVLKNNTRFYQKQGISTYLINHFDEMCKDMGVNPWRKKNWFSEAFNGYVSHDYAD